MGEGGRPRLPSVSKEPFDNAVTLGQTHRSHMIPGAWMSWPHPRAFAGLLKSSRTTGKCKWPTGGLGAEEKQKIWRSPRAQAWLSPLFSPPGILGSSLRLGSQSGSTYWVLGTSLFFCGCLFLKITEPISEEWSAPISNLLSLHSCTVFLPFLPET